MKCPWGLVAGWPRGAGKSKAKTLTLNRAWVEGEGESKTAHLRNVPVEGRRDQDGGWERKLGLAAGHSSKSVSPS